LAVSTSATLTTGTFFFTVVLLLLGCLPGRPTPCQRQGLRRGTTAHFNNPGDNLYPVAEADDLFDAIARQEGIALNFFGSLTDAVHTASALDESDDGPRQVIVNDDRAVLEVPVGEDRLRVSSEQIDP
jgi:hypothetical protein